MTTLEEYDAATDTWTTKTPMTVPGYSMEAVALAEKLYVVGGFNWNTLHQKFLRVYDPTTDHWTDGPPMTQGREGPGSAVLNGQIYVVGGNGADLKSVEIYCP
jgi:N-acetylneuraminic acid mutarotase